MGFALGRRPFRKKLGWDERDGLLSVRVRILIESENVGLGRPSGSGGGARANFNVILVGKQDRGELRRSLIVKVGVRRLLCQKLIVKVGVRRLLCEIPRAGSSGFGVWGVGEGGGLGAGAEVFRPLHPRKKEGKPPLRPKPA